MIIILLGMVEDFFNCLNKNAIHMEDAICEVPFSVFINSQKNIENFIFW